MKKDAYSHIKAKDPNVAEIPLTNLYMLVNHIEYCLQRGAFNQLPSEQQFLLLKNLMESKGALGDFTPQTKPANSPAPHSP